MNNNFIFLQKWFEQRTPRGRLYLFVSGFALLYLLSYIFFIHPISTLKNDLLQQSATLQTEKINIRQQMDKINEMIKNPIFLQLIAEEKRLTLHLEILQQQLDALKPSLSAEDLPMLTKKILSLKRNNVILVSLLELPVEPWPSKDMADKSDLLAAFSGLYQHILQIEFQNDYFSTINYLEQLQRISSHVYWDSMEYKVLEYPKADVIIKFHVLSLQKS